ncbi:MAG: hypothetical protein QNJ70_20565 [Xenococcaceae cyanobacterium MO_207.B15]|nr:hypothetical protein [Xenococcaceae cyanobacterium MO_207.B15]
METNTSSEVYYFWQDTESNTHGVTVAKSENDNFSVVEEFAIAELSAITAPESEGGNGEGAAWGDALVSNDGSRIFINARNADKVVVIDTAKREVETILDVGDRPVHSFIYEDELWVHVDGDGGFNVIDQETLEVSEFIATNTVGTGHGKLLVSEELGANTYVTNTQEPAVFPINLETREVGAPIKIGGGNPEIGTHDKGYDPATGLAFFQLTGDAGFSFIDTTTNEVIFDQVPIVGRVAHTPDEEYILILNANAEQNDVGIWDTTLDTHTQPEFDREVTIGGGVSINGTEFYQDGNDWEAWIPQTSGDNIAVLNLNTNEVDYIDVGNLTVPEGARHFSRLGEIDSDYFFTYSDEGGTRIDLDTYEVSETIPLGGVISRMAVVETEESPEFEPVFGTIDGDTIEIEGTGQLIFAGDLNDLIDASVGSEGNNRIYAGSGDDTLILESGDRFLGGEGSDRFFVTSGGENIITGGTGADQFWIVSGEIPDAVNIITDFTSGEDVIGIAGLGISFDDLSISQQGDDALITASGSDLAILQGIEATTLVADDFTLV